MLNRKSFGPQFIMNSTPISISDSSELPIKNMEIFENSLHKSPSSSNNAYKPVNWTSLKFKQGLAHLKTPSGIDRVVNWMATNKSDTQLPEENIENKDYHMNRTTFFRCDYKVDETGALIKNSDNGLTGSFFNKSVPLCSAPKHVDNSKLSPLKDGFSNCIKNSPTCLEYCAVQRNIESTNESDDFLPRNGNIHFSLSSAESRKKELCNYLKLMNHADKKEICLSLHRRSTRVKNLGQKELAKKLSSDNCEKQSDEKLEYCSEKLTKSFVDKFSNIGESITLQSFNDLNMTIDASKYPTLNEKHIFNFVMPPNDVLNEFNDFQHWIEPILIKRNKYNNNKQNGSICSHSTENEVNMRNKMTPPKTMSHKNNLNKVRKKHRDKNLNPQRNSSQVEKQNNVEKTLRSQREDNDPIVYSLRRTKSCDTLTYDRLKEDSGSMLSLYANSIKDRSSPVITKKSNSVKRDAKKGVKRKRNGSIISENDINIRIDYDVISGSKENVANFESSSVNKENIYENKFSSSWYCHGFTETDVKESCEINMKLKNFLSKLYSLPGRIVIQNEKRECINKSHDQDVYNTKVSNEYNSDNEIDNAQSESDTVSDSLSSLESDDSSCSNSVENGNSDNDNLEQKCDVISLSEISPRTKDLLPFNDNIEMQSLHSLLKKQVKKIPNLNTMAVPDWDSDNSISEKQKSEISKHNSHFITFNKQNGPVQSAFYIDFHLILIQECAVSLWNQTALGHILGAQNLWLFNGCTKKLILNKECIRKKALEMVISVETCVAYVELWTKEHKSDIRQGPVADVFAIVYFWMQKLNKMDKKVLQLENIYGFADDVQYVVLKPSLNIVVSWHSVVENSKVTQVHVYTFAPDFQTINNVRALAKVEHYVSSLHNIEDCEELLMGCGEHKITLWNIEHGYIIASIELSDIKLSLSTLWVKCDRGILFTLQQCVDRELRLIAINGRSHSWKQLKSYKPPEGFERIQNVYIENGVLISFYEEGILCWKAQSGEQIVEEIHSETEIEYFPSGKYLIMATEKNVFIRHALTHLLTVDD